MTAPIAHVAICICTYKRVTLLERLLGGLADQPTEGRFTYSIVIVDNDVAGSAKTVVDAAAAATPTVSLIYSIEAERSIPLARNRAASHAVGDYVALIDDDEFPTERWLITLFDAIEDSRVDGVLGPVVPRFDGDAPQWLRAGGFYDRPRHRTGERLNWSDCRTGNAMLRARLLSEDLQPFDPKCLGGEDHDFFKRMIERGRIFSWCDAAVVFETIPASRWTRGFLIRRALFRGVFSLRQRRSGVVSIVRALVASTVYAILLPVALLLGPATTMRCAFNLSYHVGQVLAIFGINPIKQPYVTD